MQRYAQRFDFLAVLSSYSISCTYNLKNIVKINALFVFSAIELKEIWLWGADRSASRHFFLFFILGW